MVEDATITSKSQLTLPKGVRQALGVGPGDKIRFVPAHIGFQVIALKGDIRSMRGFFKGRRATPLTIEEMNQAIAEMGSRPERGR